MHLELRYLPQLLFDFELFKNHSKQLDKKQSLDGYILVILNLLFLRTGMICGGLNLSEGLPW
jgi:hypothetical protein